MKGMTASFSCELLKVWRSKILWISVIVFSIIPVAGGFFMFVMKNPEFAHKAGLLAAKAELSGIADWPSYYSFLSQGVAGGGLLLFGFLVSWTFGREYSDRTLKDLMALPISRIYIVLSKFLLVLLWCIFLSILVFVLGLVVGNIVGLPGWRPDLINQELGIFGISAALSIALCTPVAFFACVGKGYLPPLGFMLLAMVFAQIIGATGYGGYFPWAVPVMYSSGKPLEGASFIVVVLTSIIGLIGTSLWWRFADHN